MGSFELNIGLLPLVLIVLYPTDVDVGANFFKNFMKQEKNWTTLSLVAIININQINTK